MVSSFAPAAYHTFIKLIPPFICRQLFPMCSRCLSQNCWQQQEQSKYSQALSTALKKKKEKKGKGGGMREVCEGTQDGGTRLRKGGKEAKTIVVYNFPVTWAPACCPHCRMCLVRWIGASGVCSCWLSSVCRPKEGEKWEKEEGKASQWRRYWGFFVSPSGIDGTPAKTWIVDQESAMCPTDGPSKYEGTSCTDGQFCLCRV